MSRTQAFQLYLRLKLAKLFRIYRIKFAHYQVGLIKCGQSALNHRMRTDGVD
jgi:hypothetical protein